MTGSPLPPFGNHGPNAHLNALPLPSPGFALNGQQYPEGVPSPEDLQSLTREDHLLIEELVGNAIASRQEWMNRALADPRRNLDRECGFPEPGRVADTIYTNLYERDPLAARAVQVMARESWQVSPLVYETEDAEEITAFEEAWDALGKQLRAETSYHAQEEGSLVWSTLEEADVLSGVGHYAILLLGLDDGKPLHEPVDGWEEMFSVPVKAAGPKGKQKSDQDPVGRGGVSAQYGTYGGGDPGPGVFNSGNGNGRIGNVSREDADYNDAYLRAAMILNGREDEIPEGGFPRDDAGPTANEAVYPEGPYALTVNAKKTKGRKLLYLSVFPESLAPVATYESNPTSPRFRLPTSYDVTFNDPRSSAGGASAAPWAMTKSVHWSRIVPIADTHHHSTSSRVFATPRLEPILNTVLSAQKVWSAGAEGYWQSCFTTLSFETHPQLGGDVKVDKTKLKAMMYEVRNRLQRDLFTSGMAVKSLAPQVIDMTPFVETLINLICIKLGIPVRIFKGSERGELASTQDDAAWNDRVKQRQRAYLTPKVVVPFIDRLINVGVLPKPKAKLSKPEAVAAEEGEDAEEPVPKEEVEEKVEEKGAVANAEQPRVPAGSSQGGQFASSNRTVIGKGNTGDVYREGDTVIKSAKLPDGRPSREGEFYEELRGSVGIAPGRKVGDEIHTPFYQEILSVDAVPDKDIRQRMGDVVAPNKTRLLAAANAMSARGIDYNDPLQVGYDNDFKAHVFDFSNAGRVDPKVALRANIERTARYMEEFGAGGASDRILRTFGVYSFAEGLSHGSAKSAEDRVANLVSKGNKVAEHVQSIGPDRVAGYDVRHAYYATNPRPVEREGILQSQPDRDGTKVILSSRPLDADTIRMYDLTPVVHPYEREITANVGFPPKKPATPPSQKAPAEPDEVTDQATEEQGEVAAEKAPGRPLPPPEKEEEPGYKVEWPDIASQSKAEKADVATKEMTALAAFTGPGNVAKAISPFDMWTRIMGKDEAEAHSILDNAEEHAAAEEEKGLQKQKEQIEQGLVADPVKEQEAKIAALKSGQPPAGPGGAGGKGGAPVPGGLPPKPTPGFPAGRGPTLNTEDQAREPAGTSKGGRFKKVSLRQVALAVRGAVLDECGGSDGECVTASLALQSVIPKARTWSGVVKGRSHMIVKVGDKFVDLTPDQFGGDREVLIRGKLPKSYRWFSEDESDPYDTFGSDSLEKMDRVSRAAKRAVRTIRTPSPVANSVTADLIRKAAAKLADHPYAMPGYGQVYVRGTEVWYVGGDGDERGFDRTVKAALKVPGVTAVRYESEGFPPEGGGWERVGNNDPNQPRVPAGSEKGGQWASVGGGVASSAAVKSDKRARAVREAAEKIPVTDDDLHDEAVDGDDLDEVEKRMTDTEREKMESVLDGYKQSFVDEEIQSYDPERRNRLDPDEDPEAYEAESERLTDAYRDKLSDDYDDSEDRRHYLEEFYRGHADEERFKGRRIEDRWGYDEDGDRKYHFTTSQGNEYEIWGIHNKLKEVNNEPYMEVGFEDAKGSFAVTGAGGAHEVFGTVSAAITALVLADDPPIVSFTAAEPSRQKLYSRLVKTTAAAAPDYGAVAIPLPNGGVRYVLIKRDQMGRIVDMIPQGVAPPEVLVNAEGRPMKARFLKPEARDEWFRPDGWPGDEDEITELTRNAADQPRVPAGSPAGGQFSSIDSWAVKAYTHTDFAKVRAYMTGEGQEGKELSKALVQALPKLPKYRGATYRGLTFDDPQDAIRFLDGLETSGRFRDKSVMSASKGIGIAQKFAADDDRGILIKIISRTGADLSGVGDKMTGHEDEVLFGPKSKFKVVKVRKAKKESERHTVVLKEFTPRIPTTNIFPEVTANEAKVVVKDLAAYLHGLVADVTMKDARNIARAVKLGTEEGLSDEQVANVLKKVLPEEDFNDYRTRLIATTEMTRARGELLLIDAAAAGESLVRFTAHPDCCDDCQKLNGREYRVGSLVGNAFDPAQPRDGDGKWAGTTTKPPGRPQVEAALEGLRENGMGFDTARVVLVPVTSVRVVEEGVKRPAYREEYERGVSMPPPAVVRSGDVYEIMDGNKRFQSVKAAGLTHMHVLEMDGFDLGKGVGTVRITANDRRPKPASGVIPVHPGCKCRWDRGADPLTGNAGKRKVADQPRVPAGTDRGGEFVSTAGKASAHDDGHRDLGTTEHGRERDKIDKVLNDPEVLAGLKPPEYMYHVAPKAVADKILKEGLKFGSPRSSEHGEIRGVYLTDSPHDLGKQGGDIGGKDTVILKVKTAGLKLRLDPEYFYWDDKTKEGAKRYVQDVNDGMEQFALYSPVSIPASHIVLNEATTNEVKHEPAGSSKGGQFVSQKPGMPTKKDGPAEKAKAPEAKPADAPKPKADTSTPAQAKPAAKAFATPQDIEAGQKKQIKPGVDKVTTADGKSYAVKQRETAEAGGNAEKQVSDMARVAGVNVPRTEKQTVGSKPAVVTEWAEGGDLKSMTPEARKKFLSQVPKEQVDKHVMFDYLIGHGDTHNGNFIAGAGADGKPALVGIDKELWGHNGGHGKGTKFDIPQFVADLTGGYDTMHKFDRKHVDEMIAAGEKMATAPGISPKDAQGIRNRVAVLKKFAEKPDDQLTTGELWSAGHRGVPSAGGFLGKFKGMFGGGPTGNVFDPKQPRDEQGRWAGSGAGAKFAPMPAGKATSKEAKAWRKRAQADYDADPEFRAVADAVTLYTQGDYAVMRAFSERAVTGEMPPEYKDSAVPGWADKGLSPNPLANVKPYFAGQDGWIGEDAKGTAGTTYSRAGRALVDAVADSPPSPTPLYRGVTGHRAVEAAAALKPGDDFQMIAPTSFTLDKTIGEQFSSGTAKGQGKAKDFTEQSVVFEVAAGARALPVSAMSPWDQKEALTSGKFKVREVKVGTTTHGHPQSVHVVLEQVEVFRPLQEPTANVKTGKPRKGRTKLEVLFGEVDRPFEVEPEAGAG